MRLLFFLFIFVFCPLASFGLEDKPHLTGSASQIVSAPKMPVNASGQLLPQEFMLPNGLHVLILEEHAFPMVSSMMWYRAGSRNEGSGQTGLSHLVEHLLFQNIGGYKKNELGALIVANGGQFNGFTSEDFTAFYANLPSSKLELAIRGEAERIRGAKFSKADVQSEVTNLIREFDQDGRDPLATLTREVHATVFGQHPYANPPSGWQQDVEKLTYEDARQFYDRYYHPNNATLVLVGDLKTATALALVKREFAAVPKSSLSFGFSRGQGRVVNIERRLTMHTAMKKEAVVMGFRAPAVSDADAPAMTVLERCLNAQLSGRLRKQLLDPKICSSAQAVFELKHDPSAFMLTLTSLPGTTLPKLIEAGDNVIAQMRTQICSEPELSRAKRQAQFDFYSEADGPYKSAFHIGFFDSLWNWAVAFNWTDKLQSVTAGDVQRVANRYLNTDGRVIGILSSNSPTNQPAAPKASPQTTGYMESPDMRSHLRTAAYKMSDQSLTPNGKLDGTGATVSPAATRATAVSAKAEATESGTPLSVRAMTQKTLSNGINLIVIESHLSPLVEVFGIVKAGSAFEPPNKKGVAALLCSLLNSGSNRGTKQQWLSDQDDLGLPPRAMLRFDNGIENLTFQTTCLSKDLNSQLAKVGSALREPRFGDADLDKSRQEVLNVISQTEDTTKAKVQRALMRNLASSASPFCPSDPTERAKSVNSLKVQDVRDYYNKNVTPGATEIVVAGDVSAASVSSLLERNMQAWSGSKDKPKVPSLAAEGEQNQKRATKSSIPVQDKSQSLVCLGRIVPVTSKESEDKLWSHLLIANCALSNHPFFSRLSQKFNADPSLSGTLDEDLRSQIQSFPDASIWSLVIPVDAGGSSTAVTTIQTELRKFCKAGLTQEELIEAKRYLLGSIPVADMSSLDGLCRTTMESFEQRDELSPLVKTSASIRGATLESVNKFVADNFKPDQSAVVVAAGRQFVKQVHPNE